jgi:hypothetical protein
LPRYPAVADEISRTRGSAPRSRCGETEQEAFAFVGEAVFDGDQADGVYDLDTAEKIDVHISVPIVTRADVQGVSAKLHVE